MAKLRNPSRSKSQQLKRNKAAAIMKDVPGSTRNTRAKYLPFPLKLKSMPKEQKSDIKALIKRKIGVKETTSKGKAKATAWRKANRDVKIRGRKDAKRIQTDKKYRLDTLTKAAGWQHT